MQYQKIKNYIRRILRGPSLDDTLRQLKKDGLIVGTKFHMENDVVIDPSHCWHISIGNNVTLAPRVHILAHDASTKHKFGYTFVGKVNIGNNVFIGASSIILPGVSIGNNCVIGAGSVVSRDIPPNSVAAGNPAKVIKKIDEFHLKHEKQLKIFPIFDESFTIRSDISNEKKIEMNSRMVSKFGYVE